MKFVQKENFDRKIKPVIEKLCTQLHPPPPSSLQHPQLYENQNIAHNLAVFQNLGRKIQSWLFWQKIDTDGILVVLIPNLDLNLWNSDPKIQYLGKFGQENSKFSVLPKNCTNGIWRILILISTLVFWIYNPKSILGQIWAKKSKLSDLHENWHLRFLEDADSYSDISFLNFKT